MYFRLYSLKRSKGVKVHKSEELVKSVQAVVGWLMKLALTQCVPSSGVQGSAGLVGQTLFSSAGVSG